VTGDALIETVQSVFSDHRLVKLEFWLADRTLVSKFDVTAQDARKIASISNIALVKNSKMAVALVSPSGVEFGISRIITSLANLPNPHLVCRSVEEANEWIVRNRGGVPMPESKD